MDNGRKCWLYSVEEDAVRCYEGTYYEDSYAFNGMDAVGTHVGWWSADDKDILILWERDDELALKELRRNRTEALEKLIHEINLLDGVVLNG